MPVIPPISASSISIGSGSPALSRAAKPPTPSEVANSFGDKVINALDKLDSMQKNTDQLAQKAATGDLQSINDYMVASTETQLTTSLTLAVRNKAVEAFSEIMKMQI
jgi:flagellar hook-basal body complex protein FliE